VRFPRCGLYVLPRGTMMQLRQWTAFPHEGVATLQWLVLQSMYHHADSAESSCSFRHMRSTELHRFDLCQGRRLHSPCLCRCELRAHRPFFEAGAFDRPGTGRFVNPSAGATPRRAGRAPCTGGCLRHRLCVWAHGKGAGARRTAAAVGRPAQVPSQLPAHPDLLQSLPP